MKTTTAKRFSRFTLPLLVVACLLSPAQTRGAELSDHADSLEAIPADASLYLALLKNREQVDAILQSNAWRKFTSIPALQLGLMQLDAQWQFPTNDVVRAIKEWVEGDEGQDVLALLREMASEEGFLYVDGASTDLLEILVELNSQISRGQFETLQNLEDLDLEGNGVEALVLEVLEEHLSEFKVPGMVIGFRIDDKDRAAKLLDLAEQRLRPLLEMSPVPLSERLERVQTDRYNLMTMTFDSEMIPWDDIEVEAEVTPEMFLMLKSILEGQEAVFAFGVVDNFIVFSLGASLEPFEEVGSGALLADTKEFDKLDKHAAQKIVSIAYVSDRFMKAIGSNERTFKDMAVTLKGLLALAGLDEERSTAIKSDIDELTDDLLEVLPEPGAIASVSFMTGRGYETYTYNWAEIIGSPGDVKPLSLINHLGSDSLAWYVGRESLSVEGYDKFFDWGRRAFDHAEAIAKEQADDEEWEKYVEVRDQVLPILQRIDDANRNQLIPAMADGQGAIVLEASSSDENWCDFMPPAAKPLPLPTLALVYGISDAELLKQGATEYFDIAGVVIDRLREANPDEFPAFELPEPTRLDYDAGEVFAYELPEEWGASPRIAPNAGLSDSVLVLSLMPELSKKFLEGDRPEVDGPAAQFDKPLLSAGHCNFAKMLELVPPWVDYGIQTAIAQGGEEMAGAVAAIGFVKPQIDQLLEVLGVFKSCTGVSYYEDGVTVTHGETRIVDLED